jgi:hypothetical protein
MASSGMGSHYYAPNSFDLFYLFIEDNTNPFMGFFTGMMSQFMCDAMANASLPAFPISTLSNTPVATNTQPLLPTISVPPVIPYSSLRQSIALPAAPTGHPLQVIC